MSKGSAIVLNASINAHLGLTGTTVCGATKAAVINMAKTLSADLLNSLEASIRECTVRNSPPGFPVPGTHSVSEPAACFDSASAHCGE